jgi:hypothetical protein
MLTIERWDDDKPHRCPKCHAVAVDMERPGRWKIYACCRCGCLFSRHPCLAQAGALRLAGIMCSQHRCGATENGMYIRRVRWRDRRTFNTWRRPFPYLLTRWEVYGTESSDAPGVASWSWSLKAMERWLADYRALEEASDE